MDSAQRIVRRIVPFSSIFNFILYSFVVTLFVVLNYSAVCTRSIIYCMFFC